MLEMIKKTIKTLLKDQNNLLKLDSNSNLLQQNYSLSYNKMYCRNPSR